MEKLLLSVLILFLSTAAWSQGQVVSGKVTSADDQMGLPGVNVIVEGTTKGTTTDSEGQYSIELVEGETTLVFSFVGFAPQTVQVGGRTTIDIVLDPDLTTLSEVVVVGYGTQRKVDITGSITQVDGTDITKQPAVNAMSAIQGKVAGVQVTNNGQPGASPQIRIRGLGTVYGNANPLFVVDGVWYDDISWLNPGDIENLSVLKDASSSAIYGVRAANGVVLITTKKGRPNTKAVVTYDGFVGNQVVTNQVKMANGPEFATTINELDITNGAPTGRYENPAGYGTTDWYGQILRDALITSHQVSIAGGGERSTYNFSLGYLNQEGIVEDNSFKRYTARLQNDMQVFDFLKIGYSATAALNNSVDIPGGIFHQLYSAAPIVPVYYADNTYGDPNDYNVGNSNAFNPQVTLDFFDQKSKNYRLTGSVFGEVKFAKHFTFRSSLGGDYGQNELNNFTPVYTATLAQRNATTILSRERSETRNWLLENTLTFDKQFDEHGVKVLVGQGAQGYQFYKMTGTARNVPNTSVGDHYFTLGDPGTRFITDEGAIDKISSYFARVNYSYADRYLLTASFRADGSSKFSGDDQWGYFPTIGAGWVISEEGFMKDQQIFNNLKLRGSWGQIGNRSVPAQLSVLKVTQAARLTYVGGNGATFPGASINTITPLTTAWEKGEGTDIGLEAALLDNRLSAEIVWYNRKTKEAIFDIPILGHIGMEGSTIIGNQATFQNQGMEFMVTWRDESESSGLSYSIGANLSMNENEVLEVSSGSNPIYQAVGTTGSANFNTRTVFGEPIGQFFGLKVVGIFQNDQEILDYVGSEGDPIQPNANPGDFKFQDVNSDGVVDDKDRVVLGNPNPKYVYGINTTWAYKNFDLTLDFQGVSGVEIYNATLGVRYGTENFTKEFFDNRWHGEGTSNTYPSANIGGGQNYRSNSFFVEKGDYFRMRNVQLGYTLPSSTTEKWKINRLRIYANAQNALNFFKYRGFSPEIGGDPTRAGVDINVYPLYATYNFGVNATF